MEKDGTNPTVNRILQKGLFKYSHLYFDRNFILTYDTNEISKNFEHKSEMYRRAYGFDARSMPRRVSKNDSLLANQKSLLVSNIKLL